MRATTAFNRLLALESTTVKAVRFDPDAIVVVVALRTRLLRCPDCDYTTPSAYDRRPNPSRWRHLDVCGRTLTLECDLSRVACPTHGVRTQAVPFARPGARLTRQMENLIVWCAASMDWTAVSVLCRVAWRTVAAVVDRVVPTTTDLDHLEGLVRIGVDEISWKRGHKYLTLVVDHDTGTVIWGAKDRTAKTLEDFFDELGDERTAALEAISMDFGAPYAAAVRAKAPNAKICLDTFHAVALATKALDEVRRQAWQQMRRNNPAEAKKFKGARFVLLANQQNLTETQQRTLAAFARHGGDIWLAYQLKEAVRGILTDHTLTLDDSIDLLQAWIDRATHSGLAPFARLAKTFAARFNDIYNTWETGITNARNEGTHSAIRAVFARAHGFHRAETALAAINLTCGPTPIPNPHPTPVPAAA